MGSAQGCVLRSARAGPSPRDSDSRGGGCTLEMDIEPGSGRDVGRHLWGTVAAPAAWGCQKLPERSQIPQPLSFHPGWVQWGLKRHTAPSSPALPARHRHATMCGYGLMPPLSRAPNPPFNAQSWQFGACHSVWAAVLACWAWAPGSCAGAWANFSTSLKFIITVSLGQSSSVGQVCTGGPG